MDFKIAKTAFVEIFTDLNIILIKVLINTIRFDMIKQAFASNCPYLPLTSSSNFLFYQ